MPYLSQFLDEGRAILHIGTGTVTGAEILERVIEDHRLGERLRAVRYALVDLSGATAVEVTAAEIQRIAAEHRQMTSFMPQVAIAVISPQDIGFGMARMWEAFVADTGWMTRVFRAREEATAWLAERLQKGTGDQ